MGLILNYSLNNTIMKKKNRLSKVIMSASVLTMGVGLVQSFNLEAQTTGGGCYQRMVICNGSYTVYHCDGQFTSSKCSTYEIGCKNC